MKKLITLALAVVRWIDHQDRTLPRHCAAVGRVVCREVWFALFVVPVSALTYWRFQRLLKRIEAEIKRLSTSRK